MKTQGMTPDIDHDETTVATERDRTGPGVMRTEGTPTSHGHRAMTNVDLLIGHDLATDETTTNAHAVGTNLSVTHMIGNTPLLRQ